MRRRLVRDYNSKITESICEYAGKLMIDIPEVAARSGIPKSTLYSRLENPGSFRVWELIMVCDALHIPENERGELIR